MREFLCLQKDPMSRNRFPQVNLDYNLLTNQSLYNDFNLNQGNQGLSMEVMTLTLSFSTSPKLFTYYDQLAIFPFVIALHVFSVDRFSVVCINETKNNMWHRGLTSYNPFYLKMSIKPQMGNG